MSMAEYRERRAAQARDRTDRILEAAIALAKSVGYQWITREMVAAQAKCATGSVNFAFGSMIGLKREVLQAAVDRGIIEIVAQGLADGHPIARAAPEGIRAQAVAHLAG